MTTKKRVVVSNQAQDGDNVSEKDTSKSSEHADLHTDVENTDDPIGDISVLQNTITEQYVKISELNDKVLRIMAEKDNMQKRYEKQIGETGEYAITSFAKDLLDVMDNLVRALDHAPSNDDKNANTQPVVSNIMIGVKMTKDTLENVFSKHGIILVHPGPGEKFDYNAHYAVSQTEIPDTPAGVIASVMQSGYKIKTRILRPAMVVVTK